MDPRLDLALEKERLLKKTIEYQENLPHLYGWAWYPWAREFFESTNKQNFLCAANQISKSSTQIRKCIDWATNKRKWKTLWKTTPHQFWYLYPSAPVATIEFEKKWVTEFLPKGKFKDDPEFGWKAEYKKGEISAIHFNSGITVYFKFYTQDIQNLQTGTVHALFCDEELPEELYDELSFRLAAIDGYFHMVFTATLGQQLWKDTIEGKGIVEKFPDAFKLQISMYDCLKYEDGTPSPWTKEKIQRIINGCKSPAEVSRRVWGKFIKDSGLKYQAFDKNKNVKKSHPLPKDWRIYAGVDIGSGGDSGHPAAICFVGVSPDFKKGRVFKGWRGDGIVTTSKDILDKFVDLRGEMKCEVQYYDWAAKDFYVIASRVGETFVAADKSQDSGEGMLNVLFKNEMLAIYEDGGDGELKKLTGELVSINKNTPKQKAKDDFADALRYACSKIPWNWEAISSGSLEVDKKEETPYQEEVRKRREMTFEQQEFDFGVGEEFEEWNEQYGA